MKLKHNKKRNTAFLFEILTKELTKAIVSSDLKLKKVVVGIIKESFGSSKILKRELDIYKSILESQDASAQQAEKIYNEACRQYRQLDCEEIFEQQTNLINKINRALSPQAFDNFVPSYTLMATAHQLFNAKLDPKSLVLLEEKVVSYMSRKVLEKNIPMRKMPSDKLAMRAYLKKFNKTFKDDLLVEQKSLLSKYINSFSDNGLGLKVFLNEEIPRIRKVVEEKAASEEKLNPILETIDGFKGQWITTDLLKKILRLQELAGELSGNGS